jgi:reactive intermediate/imine deaminase
VKKVVATDKAPRAIGPYSQAIQYGNVVYLSGQIPLDPVTMTLVSDDISQQAKQVFANLKAVCEAAGGSLGHLLKITIYLTDLTQFSLVNDIMSTYFTEPYPARATVQVVALPKAAQIEVDGVMGL